MKTWNKPELAEVNINETANGFFCSDTEWCVWLHDDTPSDNKKKEDTPDDPIRKIDQNS